MSKETGAIEGGRDWGVIVAPCLDDFGLNPYEMRVYIRLARRAGMGGQCWESISKMAAACKMSVQKVKNSLALLADAHLIKQIKRPGKSDLYELLPECHWVKATELDTLRSQVTAYRFASDQRRQELYHQETETDLSEATSDSHYPKLIKQPSYEVANYGVANYEVATTQLRGSSLPNYEVASTELRGSYPPSYEVATKISHRRIPSKNSPEEIPLTLLTPLEEQTHESASETDVCQEKLRQVAKGEDIYTLSASLKHLLRQAGNSKDLSGDECSATRVKTQTAEITTHTPTPPSQQPPAVFAEKEASGQGRTGEIEPRETFCAHSKNQTVETTNRTSTPPCQQSAANVVEPANHLPEKAEVPRTRETLEPSPTSLSVQPAAAVEAANRLPKPSASQPAVMTKTSFPPTPNSDELTGTLQFGQYLPWEIPGKRNEFAPELEQALVKVWQGYSNYRGLTKAELLIEVRLHIRKAKNSDPKSLEIRSNLYARWQALHQAQQTVIKTQLQKQQQSDIPNFAMMLPQQRQQLIEAYWAEDEAAFIAREPWHEQWLEFARRYFRKDLNNVRKTA